MNGACLTVTRLAGKRFTVDVSPETLRRTTLGRLAAGTRVNLERALRLGDRMGGHLVQGHVDGVGKLAVIRAEGDWRAYRFRAPAQLAPYLVKKGSIAVGGRVSRRELHGRPHPAQPRRDDPGRAAAGRPREPRSRHIAETGRCSAARLAPHRSRDPAARNGRRRSARAPALDALGSRGCPSVVWEPKRSHKCVHDRSHDGVAGDLTASSCEVEAETPKILPHLTSRWLAARPDLREIRFVQTLLRKQVV